MARFVLRKLGSTGDTCVAVAERDLAGHLRQELEDGYSVALRTGETTQLVGGELGQVMAAVQGEVSRGAGDVELLLIPRVAGG